MEAVINFKIQLMLMLTPFYFCSQQAIDCDCVREVTSVGCYSRPKDSHLQSKLRAREKLESSTKETHRR